MASSKLKNIQAIRQMLDGTHKTQTRKSFGFTGDQTLTKKREIGEEWEEYDEYGNVVAIWVQHKGWREKKNPYSDILREVRDDIFSYKNCRHEECKLKHKTRLDKKFQITHGMCADCVFEMETELKIRGKFEEYEKNRMLSNAKSFFKDSDSEIEDVRKVLTENPTFVNSDGTVETWERGGNVADKILEEYEQFKKIILNSLGEEE